MVVAVTAELVATVDPDPVRVTVTGLAVGDSVVIEGVSSSGSWRVPGGVFMASDSEVALIDNRAPFNVPVTYQATVDGAVVATSDYPVMVPFDSPVLQSLDGQVIVPFVLVANGLPMEPDMRVYTADVAGRGRPVSRYDSALDGGGSMSIRTTKAATAALRSIWRAGGPVVVRMAEPTRDYAPTEILTVVQAPSVMWDSVEGAAMGTERVHSLTYLLADDPDPSRPVTLNDWTDFNEAMVRLGWDYADLQDFLAGLPDWADAAQVLWSDM